MTGPAVAGPALSARLGLARASVLLLSRACVLGLSLAAVAVAALACTPAEAAPGDSARSVRVPGADAAAPAPLVPAPSAPAVALVPAPAAAVPWRATAQESLEARFAPPPGFTRVAIEAGSFAAFLRVLPVLPKGADVVDYAGHRVRQGDHPNIAAVVDIDVGTKDLQQCADAIVRLDAEWRWSRGDRDLVYRAVSGEPLSYARYRAGERAVVSGAGVEFRKLAEPRANDHAVFRRWLDEVFAWAGTLSISRDGKRVPREALRGGDFFVLTGSPFGHAVLVLDVARDANGRTAVLLGQSFMPAQSFHVVRPDPTTAWFPIEPGADEIATPFWKPFPITTLRRL
jgi:hypothetical protein